MNITNILYEPYFIIILISIIITIIAYFIIKENNKNKNEKINIPFTLFCTFVLSLIILVCSKYIIIYMNNNNFFQKGGNKQISDNITIVADDIDIGLFDE